MCLSYRLDFTTSKEDRLPFISVLLSKTPDVTRFITAMNIISKHKAGITHPPEEELITHRYGIISGNIIRVMTSCCGVAHNDVIFSNYL